MRSRQDGHCGTGPVGMCLAFACFVASASISFCIFACYAATIVALPVELALQELALHVGSKQAET